MIPDVFLITLGVFADNMAGISDDALTSLRNRETDRTIDMIVPSSFLIADGAHRTPWFTKKLWASEIVRATVEEILWCNWLKGSLL